MEQPGRRSLTGEHSRKQLGESRFLHWDVMQMVLSLGFCSPKSMVYLWANHLRPSSGEKAKCWLAHYKVSRPSQQRKSEKLTVKRSLRTQRLLNVMWCAALDWIPDEQTQRLMGKCEETESSTNIGLLWQNTIYFRCLRFLCCLDKHLWKAILEEGWFQGFGLSGFGPEVGGEHHVAGTLQFMVAKKERERGEGWVRASWHLSEKCPNDCSSSQALLCTVPSLSKCLFKLWIHRGARLIRSEPSGSSLLQKDPHKHSQRLLPWFRAPSNQSNWHLRLVNTDVNQRSRGRWRAHDISLN